MTVDLAEAKRLLEILAISAELTRLKSSQDTLFAAIAHGDDEHRAWLEKAIADHFAGRPVERPTVKSSQAEHDRTVRRAALEEAITACREQQAAFLSPQYATNQPASSFSERFACKLCIQAIGALIDQTGGEGGNG